MKHFDVPIKRFMAKFNRYEPYIQDSTQMVTLKKCDRKYFYRMVLGFAPRVQTYQTNLDWGSARHKFRETLEKTNDPQLAMKAAQSVRLSIPSPGSPEAKYDYLDKANLLKALASDYAQWMKEKEQGKIKVVPDSIEQPINVQLPDGSFTGGRVDQMINWAGDLWDRDFKTTSKDQKRFSKEKDPDDQSTRYIYTLSRLAGKLIGGVIFDCLYSTFTKKDGYKVEHYNHIVTKSQKQLDQWEMEQIHLNKQLKLNRDSDIWPMREGNCAFCEYSRVCRMPNEASQMAKLESDFVVKPWNFLEVDQVEL